MILWERFKKGKTTKMSFREDLEQFRKQKLNICRVLVAEELDNYLSDNDIKVADDDLTENEFEIICEYVYDWYMHTQYCEPCEIIHILFSGLVNDYFTIEDIRLYNHNVKQYINENI